jgi:NAD+ synthase (glutamine-hydrolysing)
MDYLRVAGAQLNLRVGDIDGNAARIAGAMEWAEARDADVLLLPELAVPGYPPEDLLLRPGFVTANLRALRELAARSGRTTTVVGFVDRIGETARRGDARSRELANAAAVLAGGDVVGVYHKVLLPNYGVFDEARYFSPGDDPARSWEIAGHRVGVSVCEDIWSSAGPPRLQAAAGARVLLNINGSPYHVGKSRDRATLLSAEAVGSGAPVVYLNLVGGQDELVFDGDSMVFGSDGELRHRAAQFAEELFVVDLDVPGTEAPPGTAGVEAPLELPPTLPRLDPDGEIYRALVTGLRDYVLKNGFREVVVGLSGGIDSALTCALAVDALGPEAVWGVTMPARYSSEGSVADSAELAERLGCRFDIIPIDGIFGEFLEALEPAFAATDPGVAEENLQARIRGAVLMALSNKFGSMVVATGNKSEMAVGYATLYGDMAGGFAVLKDVFKTRVYRLAEWRNRDREVIPRAIIDKEPSAELRPDQRDADSLPPYDLLDAVLERYVEQDASVDDIVAEGHPRDVVRRVAGMVDRNEYKRRQAAPGVRITQKGFGKDRRLPITNSYRE